MRLMIAVLVSSVKSPTVTLPSALLLATRAPRRWGGAHVFAVVFACCLVAYVPWGWASDLPSNWRAWRADERHHKRYFRFWAGVVDAATTRHATRAWDAWGHKLLWMTVYFSGGVWSSIALATAPRAPAADDAKATPLLADAAESA